VATKIIIIAAMLVMSAYFSATETAFLSVNKTRLKAMAGKGKRRAQLVLELSEKYDQLISSILIGNNIVNIVASSVATVLFVDLLGNIGVTVSTVVLTILVLVFGEISPKSIAKDCAEGFAMFSAPIIKVVMVLTAPLNYLFSLWKKMLARLLKVEKDRGMSQEELLMLVEEVQQDGSIDETEGDLLRNAIEFGEQKAEDILTHRTDLEAVSVDMTKEEIAEAFSRSRFSRLLVYEESIDNIVGVIHQKDLYSGARITDRELKDIIVPPLFVTTTERIDNLLKILQKTKSHIAVVLDEYGGTEGIVTMEDILEELVGEIWDEHDEVVVDFRDLGSGVYSVDGSVDIDDFSDYFGLDIESESVSVGGWLMSQLGKMPMVGDVLHYGSLEITVKALDGHRVDMLQVKRMAVSDAEPAEEA
jgi:putative hemolysin